MQAGPKLGPTSPPKLKPAAAPTTPCSSFSSKAASPIPPTPSRPNIPTGTPSKAWEQGWTQGLAQLQGQREQLQGHGQEQQEEQQEQGQLGHGLVSPRQALASPSKAQASSLPRRWRRTSCHSCCHSRARHSWGSL